MTILANGGAGFIGAKFVLDWVAQAQESGINQGKLTYSGDLEHLNSLEADERNVFEQADIAGIQVVELLLAVHTISDTILNFAAESHVGTRKSVDWSLANQKWVSKVQSGSYRERVEINDTEHTE
ncbi:GDP-mannose 4,6-dehydratase [Pseudomonas reactans]